MDGGCSLDKVLTKNMLNQGTKLPYDAEDCSTALTVCGLRRIIKDTGNNVLQQAFKEFFDSKLDSDEITRQILEKFLIEKLGKDDDVIKVLKTFLTNELKTDPTTIKLIQDIITNSLKSIEEYRDMFLDAI